MCLIPALIYQTNKRLSHLCDPWYFHEFYLIFWADDSRLSHASDSYMGQILTYHLRNQSLPQLLRRPLVAIMLLWTISEGFALAAGIPQFHAFKDVDQLKGILRKVSLAVVKLDDATGSFVCYQNQSFLMTNHHVLGTKNCAVEGCYAKAILRFEARSKATPILLHATPIVARQDLDVSFFQVKQVTDHGHQPFKPDYCLTLNTKRPKTSSPILLIGHPRGGVKKFSKGHILENHRGHIFVSAFSLPGSSGSPLVNHKGEVVGIHHSSAKHNDMFSREEIIYRGRGSSAEAIFKVLQRSLKTPKITQNKFIQTTQPINYTAAKKYTRIFLKAHKHPILNHKVNFFDQLYLECSQGINKTYRTLRDLSAAHKSCHLAKTWINCSHMRSRFTYGYCPVKNKRHKWRNLFGKISKQYQKFHGSHSSAWQIAAYALDSTNSHHHFMAAKLKPWLAQQYLTTTKLHQLFEYSLLIKSHSIKLPAKENRLIWRFLSQYDMNHRLKWHLRKIAQISYNLFLAGNLTQDQLSGLLNRLLNERQLTLHSLLTIEKFMFEARNISQVQNGAS
ncbi:MAG: serine protease [Proteobacteria bacterium]|nr:serine protease [Pseudomonadota bacterium]